MSTETQFGPFFRATRKALGLNLREFCRRNGLDPGNISRLERGLAPPPRAQETLESLAKALKLKEGTERWERFFGLAGAATGRIPSELLQERTTAAQLPGLFRQLRGGQGHKNWVTARQLEEWAGTEMAPGMLPELVRRLVHATGCGVIYRQFPAGEQVRRPGWDGVAEAKETDEFVPEGVSGWEMSVDTDPAAKFEDDFAKRSKNPQGLNKRETTFVFVTPRKWQKKGDRLKAKLGTWKDVRVYDSASLEEWLERAPAVDVWLAQTLGIRPDGIADIDEYWANLAAVTDPSLTREVFLASRGKEVEQLGKWLEGPPGALVIETRSPTEAVDFLAAFSRTPAAGDAFKARAVIVETREAWRAMAASDNKLIMIAHPVLAVEPELVAEAVRQGQHAVLCSEQAGDRVSKLQLPRVYRYDLQKALVAAGLEPPQASDYASKAGGSLTVLKRLLGRYPGTTQPEWSCPPAAASLVPFLLAGSWEETVEGDRQVLERLSMVPYHEVSSLADRWLHTPDPPVTRVLSRLALVSRDDSWFLLAHAVTQDHLHRFEQVAGDVLSEGDPAYELPPDERWQANLHGKVLRHSQTLRTGLAETLVLLSARPDLIPNAPDLRRRVDHLVRTLLDGKDWQRWASLSPQLPLLAEAAPREFLAAAERDLKRSDSALVKLFEQQGDSLFSSSPHTGLLWAVEGLAWDRSSLRRVADVLAQLGDLARSGNRPMRSLQEIFKPWFPQTTAPVQERVEVLRAIAKKRPAAGWRLLISLLADRAGIATPIGRPTFRDWALTWVAGATNADYWFQVTASAHLLIDLLGNDLGRWKELLEHVETLPGPAVTKVLEQLAGFDVTSLDSAERRAITEVLRDKVARHRRFAEADWALPEEVLAELERAQQRFQPDEVVARHAWLFDQIWEVLDHQGGEEADIAELRRIALRQIEDEAGWNGVLALVEMVKAPDEAGWTLTEINSPEVDSRVIPHLLTSSSEKIARFAQGYARCRLHQTGWSWVDRFDTSGWSVAEVGELALRLPFERRTWEFVSGKGASIEEHYWSRVFGFLRSENPDDVAFAASVFLKYNRPFQACNVFRMALHQKTPVEPALVMDALEAGLKVNSDNKDHRLLDHVRYAIHQLFQELQRSVRDNDPKVDVQRLAGLEWGYLALLDEHPASPRTLHRILQTEPAFFVEILSVVFRPSSERGEAKAEPSEEEKARAQNAYRLLMSWRRVPGTGEDGTIDEPALLDWIQKARHFAEERHRLTICDSQIGEVLARADCTEEDGSWPSLPIRDALEEIGTADVFNGFEVGVLNRRRVYNKAFGERGDQEWALAKKYRAWADTSTIEWPKMAAALSRVAERYEEQARREDARSLLE